MSTRSYAAPGGTPGGPAPFDELLLVASEDGLRAVLWPNDLDGSRERERVRLGDDHQSGAADAVLDQAEAELDEYFRGERQTFDVPLDPRGTEFQVQVWYSLAQVPFGETSTYGRQADALGRPSAVRAVAAANGRNPLSIVLPCHRIVGADGSLTGFAAGLEAKAWLLDHETRIAARSA